MKDQTTIYRDDKGNEWLEDIIIYRAVVATLAASGEATVSIKLNSGSDFVWEKSTAFATEAALGAQTDSTRILPVATVKIQDTSSSNNLMDGPVPIPCIAGDGKLPYNLPKPRLFTGSSTIQFDFKNLRAVAYTNLYFNLHGVRRSYLKRA